MKIYVVGIGPGHPDYILPAASGVIERADILVAGARTLQQFAYLRKDAFTIKNNLPQLLDSLQQWRADNKQVVILASGDPGMFGILSYLRKHFVPSDLEVIPGISSVQYAMAKLALPWQDAKLLSCHGRPLEEVAQELDGVSKAAILTDPRESLAPLAQVLFRLGPGVKVYQCSDLSYPSELIREVTRAELSVLTNFKNLVLVMTNE